MENGPLSQVEFLKYQVKHEKEHSELGRLIERKVTWEHNDKEEGKRDKQIDGLERQTSSVRARLAFYAGGITVLNVGIGLAMAYFLR